MTTEKGSKSLTIARSKRLTRRVFCQAAACVLLLSTLAGVPVLNLRTGMPFAMSEAVSPFAALSPLGPVYSLTSP